MSERKEDALVEAFRKADWIDFTLGWRTFSAIDAKYIADVRAALPNAGFHWRLMQLGTKNFLSHPLSNPLPMFRR
jgi:hypothetical protein